MLQNKARKSSESNVGGFVKVKIKGMAGEVVGFPKMASSSLPDKLGRRILKLGIESSIFNYKDLYCISILCHHFRRLSSQNSLWNYLIAFYFSKPLSLPSSQISKSLYKLRFEKDKKYALSFLTHSHKNQLKSIGHRPNDPNMKTFQALIRFLPLMIGYFALFVPSGLSLYWFKQIMEQGKEDNNKEKKKKGKPWKQQQPKHMRKQLKGKEIRDGLVVEKSQTVACVYLLVKDTLLQS
ncbi:hypothetical protein VNO77_04395 [Canavalia gladiata]|uniref:F-box domain-containing protein n=1 Tax=Canavalia gladiata TaxID=3824 RepID=A0AAN9R4R8_CANGL